MHQHSCSAHALALILHCSSLCHSHPTVPHWAPFKHHDCIAFLHATHNPLFPYTDAIFEHHFQDKQSESSCSSHAIVPHVDAMSAWQPICELAFIPGNGSRGKSVEAETTSQSSMKSQACSALMAVYRDAHFTGFQFICNVGCSLSIFCKLLALTSGARTEHHFCK